MPLSDTQVFVALFVALITGILSVRLGYTAYTSKLESFFQVYTSVGSSSSDCYRMESPTDVKRIEKI